MVKRHYDIVSKAIAQLEADILPRIYAARGHEPTTFDPQAPTAVLLVNSFNGLGLTTLVQIQKLFHGQFKNVVFVSVGEVDASLLKGPQEVKRLEKGLEDDLQEYCELATDLGFHPELRISIGADVVAELRKLCLAAAREFPNLVYFAGKLIFTEEMEGFISRFLHNHTAIELQSWLQLHGLSLVILPVRVSTPAERQRAREEASTQAA
jgi:hypothetical protein